MNEECLICTSPLEYLSTDEEMECVLCHKKQYSKTKRTSASLMLASRQRLSSHLRTLFAAEPRSRSSNPNSYQQKRTPKGVQFCWRRIRDSNSGTLLQVTRFPIVRPRPTRRILHISFFTLDKYNISFYKNQEFFYFYSFLIC